jgi:hypothetical protein
LAPEINNPDVRIIKTILAIRNNPQRNNISFHIVAEIKERMNLEVAMIAGFYILKYFCKTRTERRVEVYRVEIDNTRRRVKRLSHGMVFFVFLRECNWNIFAGQH